MVRQRLLQKGKSSFVLSTSVRQMGQRREIGFFFGIRN
jgi:hypothetical protein